MSKIFFLTLIIVLNIGSKALAFDEATGTNPPTHACLVYGIFENQTDSKLGVEYIAPSKCKELAESLMKTKCFRESGKSYTLIYIVDDLVSINNDEVSAPVRGTCK
jgi:hypothetical protein